jgi:hypothetical protein
VAEYGRRRVLVEENLLISNVNKHRFLKRNKMMYFLRVLYGRY